MIIPKDERLVTDQEVFQQLNLEIEELSQVKLAFLSGDLENAKKELVSYFKNRKNVKGFIDYRNNRFDPADLNRYLFRWQSTTSLKIPFEDYLKQAGELLKQNKCYLTPDKVMDLGENLEKFPHASTVESQTMWQGYLMAMKRGNLLEQTYMAYELLRDPELLAKYEAILQQYFVEYPLVIEEENPASGWWQYSENRESMCVGWMVLNYINILFSNISYDCNPELTFQVIKRIYYLGIQFRRYDTDPFKPHNHHLFERGITPYILSLLMPEIKEFAPMRESGIRVIKEHINEDFKQDGTYNEHSIGYYFGATLSEMLARVIYISKANQDDIFDQDSKKVINQIFNIAALLSYPQDYYPVVGDKGGIEVEEILRMGAELFDNLYCKDVLLIRNGEASKLKLQNYFVHNEAGYVVVRSDYSKVANYILMTCKNKTDFSSHDHMDMLSLNITVKGKTFFEEAYAGEIYSKFVMGSAHRGFLYNMSSHNTVLVHGKPIIEDECLSFGWGLIKPETIVDNYKCDNEKFYVKAHHDGYGFARVQREFSMTENKFEIIDTIIMGNRRGIPHIQRWGLNKDVTFELFDKNSILLENNGIKLLCRWFGKEISFQFHKPEFLCPYIYKNETEMNYMLDVSFGVGLSNKLEDHYSIIKCVMEII